MDSGDYDDTQLDATLAVSYTHLDVYKRQELYCSLILDFDARCTG